MQRLSTLKVQKELELLLIFSKIALTTLFSSLSTNPEPSDRLVEGLKGKWENSSESDELDKPENLMGPAFFTPLTDI